MAWQADEPLLIIVIRRNCEKVDETYLNDLKKCQKRFGKRQYPLLDVVFASSVSRVQKLVFPVKRTTGCRKLQQSFEYGDPKRP
jgi:hypothetical protein